MLKLTLLVIFPLQLPDLNYGDFSAWWAIIEVFVFASVVTPLTDFSPNRPFQWSAQCQCAFDNAKSLLANAPVLIAPNFEKRFLLAVDASAYGAGAVLLQEDSTGIEHPVSYFSKKFSRHQQVYSTVEKEALALVLAVQHLFRGLFKLDLWSYRRIYRP